MECVNSTPASARVHSTAGAQVGVPEAFGVVQHRYDLRHDAHQRLTAFGDARHPVDHREVQRVVARCRTGHPRQCGSARHRKLLNELGFHRQALHARRLGLIHPVTGRAMSWESPLPADMRELIAALEMAA